MLLIRNALRGAGELKVEDIDQKHKPPQLNESSARVMQMDPKAKKIWNSYFILLYHIFDLPKKVDELKDKLDASAELWKTLKEYFPKTAEGLFGEQNNEQSDAKEMFLLRLLIEKPKEHAEKALPKIRKKDKTQKKEAILLETVKTAFDYDTVSSKPCFSDLILQLDVNVCPYCGRLFTATVNQQNGRYFRTSQVDHFYPKALYPFLSLSIWNWIPVCGPCNNHKSDETPTNFLYPYEDAMGDDIRFVTHVVNGVDYLTGKSGSESDFRICLEPTEACVANPDKTVLRDTAEKVIKNLALSELYATHNAYVCDMFRQRYVFGDAYQDSLVASFPDLFKSRTDVRAMLYMKRIEAEELGKAPLDKLTRDIDHEIDTLE